MFAKLIERMDKQAARMGRMMERMHVDAVALAQSRHGNAYASAHNTCMACRNSQTCDRSMAAWQAGRPDAATPESFCANARLFADYRERR